jgi:hypothetical protein
MKKMTLVAAAIVAASTVASAVSPALAAGFSPASADQTAVRYNGSDLQQRRATNAYNRYKVKKPRKLQLDQRRHKICTERRVLGPQNIQIIRRPC